VHTVRRLVRPSVRQPGRRQVRRRRLRQLAQQILATVNVRVTPGVRRGVKSYGEECEEERRTCVVVDTLVNVSLQFRASAVESTADVAVDATCLRTSTAAPTNTVGLHRLILLLLLMLMLSRY